MAKEKKLQQLDGAGDSSEDDDSGTNKDVFVNREINFNFDQQAQCLSLTNARRDSMENSVSSEDSNERERVVKSDSCARFLLTNARSLLPKMDSFNDAFQSLQLDFALVTETWFKGGKQLSSAINDFEGAKGIKILHKSRDRRLRSGGAGGVAIDFNSVSTNLKKRSLKHLDKSHEVICAVGRVGKIPRMVAAFAVYVPPKMKVAELDRLTDALSTEIASVRTSYADPVIIVGGDFNHRDMSGALNLAGNLTVVPTGPTRGTNTLDAVFTNVGESVTDKGTLPPLEGNQGTASDHRCVFVELTMEPKKGYHWQVMWRRERNPQREEAFARELREWGGPDEGQHVDAMVNQLEMKIAELTDFHFPRRRVRRRSNEDPWITRRIRRLWKKKVRLYRKGGRCQRWWATDRELQMSIAESREAYVERLLDGGSNNRAFFAATKRLSTASPVQLWTVQDLFAGCSDEEVGDKVLDYFGKISSFEAPPIPPGIPRVRDGMAEFTVE